MRLCKTTHNKHGIYEQANVQIPFDFEWCEFNNEPGELIKVEGRGVFVGCDAMEFYTETQMQIKYHNYKTRIKIWMDVAL